MKNKNIKRFISFLLCLVLLFSFPLNLHAQAVALESWLIYAIITYMAAMGVTFIAAGGVDAMVNAMEEKANQYDTVVTDFYDVLRKNIKLVPPPDPPEGSSELDLFFTAAGVEAMHGFLNWVTTEGGWNYGEQVSIETQTGLAYTYQLFDINGVSQYFNMSGTLTDGVFSIPKGVNVSGDFYIDTINSRGTVLTAGDSISPMMPNLNTCEVINNYTLDVINYDSVNPSVTRATWDFSKALENYGYSVDDAVGFTCSMEMYMAPGSRFQYYYQLGCLTSDNHVVYFGNSNLPSSAYTVWLNYFSSSLSSQWFTPAVEQVDIDFPTEFPLLSPSNVEGVLLDTGVTGADTLEAFGDAVENLFIDTGTISQPVPQIIPDPDYAPAPTPVPTPVPSPEIEDIDDLGLPQLGEALFSKFPFCLPRDIVRVFDILSAEPVTPYWEVNLTGDALGIDSTLIIDLEPYETLGQISRWFCVISFCLFLIIITKGMIGW